MDAKPYRPRGAENAPPLQQRNKASGSVASAATGPTNGLRGPAKRAAFGDVTNVSKSIGGGRDEAKLVKSQVVSIVGHGQAAVSRENAAYAKDAFARPAQRPAGLGSKLRVAADSKQSEVPKQATRPVAEDLRGAKAGLGSSKFQEATSQPRQHKSQPQLKTQQPPLRHTQSRQMEKILDEAHESAAARKVDEKPAHVRAHFDSEYMPRERDLHAEVKQETNCIELPEVAEEAELAAMSYRTGLVPPLSEPEEYWDEEEDEEYDDQDQAYTTAHSFRSRDLTTGGATTVLPPRLTARVQRELEEAALEVERTRTQEDIEEELWDISMVTEYGDEIFEYMRDLEIKMLPNPHYMDIQTEIQWSMRSVLMDWLVQVHSRFGLLPETLFLTVNYIDRFLSSKIVSIGKLQLVGATAILVASKYEEINCPSLQEIVYMVDHGYTVEEILKAERFMLSMLSFELGWPGPMSFLRRVSKADDYDLDTRTLAKYFLELTIMDERFVATPPSFLAAGAHCLSRLVLNKGDWTQQHVHYSGYTWGQLKPLVSMLLECCERPRLHHAAIFDKYSEKRFKEASLVVQTALDAGFDLPHLAAPTRSLRPSPASLDDSPDMHSGSSHLVPIES